MGYKTNNSFILAERNLKLARQLLKEGQHYNWVVVILYYSAYMYAKTLFILNDWAEPTTHDAWRREINNKVDENIGYDFGALYSGSWKCRYNPIEALDLNKNKKALGEYIEYFRSIRKRIVSELEVIK